MGADAGAGIMIYEVLLRGGVKYLRPADSDAVDFLARKKGGSFVSGKLSAPRNISFHRKFFALVDYYAEQTEKTEAAAFAQLTNSAKREAKLNQLKIMAGHFYEMDLPGGAKVRVPLSISFAKMDEESFGKFYLNVINAALASAPEIAQGATLAEKRADLERIIDGIMSF